MNTPTRRDFIACAAGATLASALPVSAQGVTHMPLVVDLFGPMAFTYGTVKNNQNVVDVWLPDLKSIQDEHEAGIITPENSYALDEKDYTLTGPPYSSTIPVPYPTFNCRVYRAPAEPDPNLAAKRYRHLTLPMPHSVVALRPVKASIYKVGDTPEPDFDYATGLRFLYDEAGTVTLTPVGGTTGLIKVVFDPAPGVTLLNMSIEYNPWNHPKNRSDDTNAKNAFTALAMFFLDLQLKVEFKSFKDGPHHPCSAPIILQR